MPFFAIANGEKYGTICIDLGVSKIKNHHLKIRGSGQLDAMFTREVSE